MSDTVTLYNKNNLLTNLHIFQIKFESSPLAVHPACLRACHHNNNNSENIRRTTNCNAFWLSVVYFSCHFSSLSLFKSNNFYEKLLLKSLFNTILSPFCCAHNNLFIPTSEKVYGFLFYLMNYIYFI